MKIVSLVGILAVPFVTLSAKDFDFARADYERCCREMTGRAAPKARFAVDASLDAKHDEYRIVSEDDGLSFVGANERAVQYAVYDFLARQGCRFYWDGDSVPKRAQFETKGLDVREKSRFEYRAIRYFAHRGSRTSGRRASRC